MLSIVIGMYVLKTQSLMVVIVVVVLFNWSHSHLRIRKYEKEQMDLIGTKYIWPDC